MGTALEREVKGRPLWHGDVCTGICSRSHLSGLVSIRGHGGILSAKAPRWEFTRIFAEGCGWNGASGVVE